MPNTTLERLRAGHRNMGHVLNHIRVQTDLMHGPIDLEAVTLLSNAVGYMRGYPGLAHHPMEDLIFTKLISATPRAQSVCANLQEQHRWFNHQGTVLLRLLRETQAGNHHAYVNLRDHAAAYCMKHAEHIETEERQVFPLALEFLSDADWTEIRMKFDGVTDPVFGQAGALQRYETLYDYLMSAK